MPNLIKPQNTILYKNEVYNIIGAAMAVHNELGSGFLEAVYAKALELEFQELGIPYQREVNLKISYKGKTLQKEYLADFLCHDNIVIELKAINNLESSHE